MSSRTSILLCHFALDCTADHSGGVAWNMPPLQEGMFHATPRADERAALKLLDPCKELLIVRDVLHGVSVLDVTQDPLLVHEHLCRHPAHFEQIHFLAVTLEYGVFRIGDAEKVVVVFTP